MQCLNTTADQKTDSQLWGTIVKNGYSRQGLGNEPRPQKLTQAQDRLQDILNLWSQDLMAWGCTIQICSHTGSYGGLPCLLPSKTKQSNHQVPHLWQKICDGHFTIKSWVIFSHDRYHQCGKLIGKTWFLSEALLHWGLSVGGENPWSVFT